MRDHIGPFFLPSALEYSRDVLILDDCQGIMRWDVVSVPVGGSAGLDSDASWFGTHGIRMLTDDGTPAADDAITITRVFQRPTGTYIVARFRFRADNWAINKLLGFGVSVNIAGVIYNSWLRLTANVGTLQYKSQDGTFVSLAPLPAALINRAWYIAELQLNWNTHSYISASLCGETYDLTGLGLSVDGAGGYDYGKILISITAAGAANAELDIDCIYVGQTETI